MKKLGLLCLAVVLALGIGGVGFAYWTETLTIDPPVSTGELKVEFMDDYGSVYSNPGNYTTALISKTGPQTLSMSLSNLYPSLLPGPGYTKGGVGVSFAIKNTGTIPAKITGLVINKTGGDAGLWNELRCNYNVSHYRADGSFITTVYSGGMGPPTTDSWNILWTSLSSRVLLPGEYFQGSMFFYVDEDAPNDVKGKSVSFDVMFTASQFNTP